ncbi:DUF3159 domain-containing protein [Glaciihabitans sp. INWT7]|uniref:DUF3159 domain-containing protein n=1 Tax=Glaciihabitans sp. INWT7 TaxID=2596912 RepID=UPI0021072367|nr:DUF3159 domain-containing protein [Glaciihabitans sp. INWT7]
MADEKSPEPGFREAFADAMRKTGLGQVAPGEVPTAGSLLKAVGGVRGLVESILPGLAFLVLYAATKNVALSVLVPVGLAVLFVVVRLATRTPITQAFAGIAGIAISAVLALISGRAEANFIPGIIINIASLSVLLLSILVRWPLIGVIVGFLTNETTQWRKQKAKRRVLYLTTWLWAGLFALRLAVEVPLYLAKEAEWLAGVKLLLGIPLYAGMLWVTWLLVRAVYTSPARPSSD